MKKAPMKQGAFFDWRGGGLYSRRGLRPLAAEGHMASIGSSSLGAKGCVAVAQGAKAVAGGFAERLGSEIGIEDRGALPGNSHPERSSG